jgi:hypothetical protein
MTVLYYKVTRKIRLIRHLLSSVWAYTKFVWRSNGNYDWDYYFLMSLILFKIERMRNCIHKADILTNTARVCRQMDYAIYLINKWKKDENPDTLDRLFKHVRKYIYGWWN